MEKNDKKMFIAIILIVILAIVGLFLYFNYLKKDKPVDDNQNNQVIDNVIEDEDIVEKIVNEDISEDVILTKTTVTEENQTIKLKDTSLNIKFSGNILYVNDTKAFEYEIDGFTGYNVYSSDKSSYLLVDVIYTSTCGSDIKAAINSNGEVFNVKRVDIDNHPDALSCLVEPFVRADGYYGLFKGTDKNKKEFTYNEKFVLVDNKTS